MAKGERTSFHWRDIFVAQFWRHRRVHAVVLIWAVIYLPGLGSVEIKGEEGRRILPAVTMLETGNFLVPYVGSEPYFRKPPLVNWLIAASFKLTGIRNEWTARLPSVLSVLAVAVAFVTVGARALGGTGSLFAALVWLVNFGLIEKGRLIEIEAIYVSLTALAFIFWVAAYRANKIGLRLWLMPGIFLGLGLLAKGPLPHLLFFYGPVIAVLWSDRNLRLLFTRAHLISVIVIFGIFVVWAAPAFLLSDSARVVRVWSRQFTGRVSGEGFQFVSWIANMPRSLIYFLPWLPLAFLEFDQPVEVRRSHLALLTGILVPFVAVNLVPASLPRFAMPALGPAAWWFGELLARDNLHWPHWLGGKPFPPTLRNRLTAAGVGIVCLALLSYGIVIVPRLHTHEKVRIHARQIDAVVPPNVPLYAVDPQYQPYLLYVRAPIRYVSTIDDLPADTKFFLVQARLEHQAQTTPHWLPARPQLVLRIKDYRQHESILFTVSSG
jgi:4-amino-4-deoxy-L-arabinose transferase and related glycosyltransferases of PMT family